MGYNFNRNRCGCCRFTCPCANPFVIINRRVISTVILNATFTTTTL